MANNIETDDALQVANESLNQRQKYRRFFSSEDQFEYFSMLPLSEKQKQVVLGQLLDDRNKSRSTPPPAPPSSPVDAALPPRKRVRFETPT